MHQGCNRCFRAGMAVRFPLETTCGPLSAFMDDFIALVQTVLSVPKNGCVWLLKIILSVSQNKPSE